MKTLNTESLNDRIKFVIDEIQTQEDISIYSLIISQDEFEYSHYFENELHPHNLRSISKLIVALCFVKILSEGRIRINGELINLNTRIWPVISKKVNLVNKNNLVRLEKITIEHLFTHTTGYGSELLFSKDMTQIPDTTYLQFLCDEPLIFEPGQHFLYSNASAFLLSVYFQETSGQKLIDFARDHFFSKMGVESFNWKTYGEYCAGATGLSLFNKDLHKFGQLLLNNGLWKNKQIISKKWIKYISTSFYRNLDNRYREDPLGINSYGLFMWICINGDYFIKGKGGHYLLVSPRNNIVISSVSHTENAEKLAKYLKMIIN